MHDIGVAGTTRPERLEFPSELDISKPIARSILKWNHLSGVVVDNVCAVLWQDNNTVLLLTTIHDIQKLVLSTTKRPAATSTNAGTVRKVIQRRESKKLLPIRELIVDYNFLMGGVDISDQLHASYTTHRKCWCNWLALWF